MVLRPWWESREGMRRRPSRGGMGDDDFDDEDIAIGVREEMQREPMAMPGFEDVPGMEGMFPEDTVTGQGEFFSRSAGYLSFVDGTFSKADLAREMGVRRHRARSCTPPLRFAYTLITFCGTNWAWFWCQNRYLRLSRRGD